MSELRVRALRGIGDVVAGDSVADLIVRALAESGETIVDRDVVVVTSKIVSKSEGRVVPFADEPGEREALIASESRRILRRRGPLRITETHHGFVNANAGIDHSNTAAGTAVLLPKDPDRSARRIRADLRRRLSVDVGVVVTDTFGRAWRHGVVDVAIGSSGLRAILDLRGTTDGYGHTLDVTEVALVDEIASTANLVLGKAARTPVAVISGLSPDYFGEGSVLDDVVRPPSGDLFR